MDPLARRYDAFYRRCRRGEALDAARAFFELAGLDREPEAPEGPREPFPTAPLIRYDAPRAVDLAALRKGARGVAKFEDLAAPRARALAEALRNEGFRVVTAGPYARRMDVTVSTGAGPADRYLVIASRGDEAERVAEAERDRTPDGTRRAGLALGYPPCCVERFVEVERSPAAERDGVNEATLRAFADAAPLAWELNPLSTLALVGFMPCRGACPLALAFARRVLTALDPRDAAVVRDALARPVLFLRYALFWALDGATVEADGSVRYARAVAHDDGSRPELSRWRDALMGAHLARADRVSLDERSLTLTRGDDVIARWGLTAPRVPRLLAFT